MSALARMPWVRACLLFWDWAACPQGQRKFACMPGSRVCGFCRPIITCMRACLLEGWGWLDAGPCLRQLPSSSALGACLSSEKARKAIASLRTCRGARVCGYCRPTITCVRACRLEGRGWLDVGPCLRQLPSSNALGAFFWEGSGAFPSGQRQRQVAHRRAKCVLEGPPSR
jgi:hypothetical protein